jgi:hypothetical protein
MGNTQAIGMADAVREHQVSLYPAIHYHLTANHFPPVVGLTDALVEVIESVNSGDLSLDDAANIGTDLPMVPRRAWATSEGWMVNVADFIEVTNAWAFIDEVVE